MHRTTRNIAAMTVLSLGVAACTDTSGVFFREAGSLIDEGGFGNPTMTNTLINTGQIAVAEQLTRRFESEVPAMVTFAFNSAQLDAEARQALILQANWIRQFPEVRFRVYGHTDLVGSNGYNRSLGLRRAQAAVRFLSQQGISRSRLEALSSFGETQPLVVTEGRERRNRRTVTEVSGFVAGHPSLLDGKYAAVIYRTYTRTGTTDTDTASVGTTTIE